MASVAVLLAMPVLATIATAEPSAPTRSANIDLTRESLPDSTWWRSQSDPERFLRVERGSLGQITFHTAGRFAAVGFARGNDVFGIARFPDAGPAGHAESLVRLAAFTARFLSPTLLSIAPDRDADPEAPGAEKWDRTASPGSSLGDTSKPWETQKVEQLPVPVTRVPPSYPDQAREDRVSGTVMIEALVGVDGSVVEVRVTKSIPALDEAALAAVKQWRFTPGRTAGRPVAAWLLVPVKFSLH